MSDIGKQPINEITLMADRIVKYQSAGAAISSESPAWAFMFELGYFNAMNAGFLPPRECLNSFLMSGRSAEASWEPFEFSLAEYSVLEERLLKPDLKVLDQHSAHGWQTFSRDPALDQYSDLAVWQVKVREKHIQTWQQRMARLQHEMVRR